MFVLNFAKFAGIFLTFIVHCECAVIPNCGPMSILSSHAHLSLSPHIGAGGFVCDICFVCLALG